MWLYIFSQCQIHIYISGPTKCLLVTGSYWLCFSFFVLLGFRTKFCHIVDHILLICKFCNRLYMRIYYSGIFLNRPPFNLNLLFRIDRFTLQTFQILEQKFWPHSHKILEYSFILILQNCPIRMLYLLDIKF